jgi:hypothetical protein
VRPDGLPDLHLMFFPKSEAHVLDTWDTSGLRGTGSHDFRANGIFVPNDRSMDFVAPVSMHSGRIYNLPLASVFNSALMGAPLGVARACIDADHFRHLIACHRPRPKAEAYLRLRTLPGELSNRVQLRPPFRVQSRPLIGRWLGLIRVMHRRDPRP